LQIIGNTSCVRNEWLQFVVMKFLGPCESSADRLQVTSVAFYGFQRKYLPDVSCRTSSNSFYNSKYPQIQHQHEILE